MPPRSATSCGSAGGQSNGGGYALSFRRKKAVQRKPAFVAVKAANAKRSKAAVHRSRAGRQSRPTCAQSAQGKARKLPKNKLACFIGNFLAFLMPGSSLCVFQVSGGNEFVFRRSSNRPPRSRRRSRLAQSSRPRRPRTAFHPHFRLPVLMRAPHFAVYQLSMICPPVTGRAWPVS